MTYRTGMSNAEFLELLVDRFNHFYIRGDVSIANEIKCDIDDFLMKEEPFGKSVNENDAGFLEIVDSDNIERYKILFEKFENGFWVTHENDNNGEGFTPQYSMMLGMQASQNPIYRNIQPTRM